MQYEGRLPDEGIETGDEHAPREFALLAGGLLAAAVACIAIAALAIDRLVLLVPPALEARWFGDLAPERSDDPRTASVQALLDRLAAHWSDAPYPFRIGVLDDPDPNAFALPGGTILVTGGLLAEMASENELAEVLGHELGHYRARDHLRGLGRRLAAQLVLGALGDSGELVSGLSAFAGTLAERRFDRDQERRADAFGLALVEAEYGHVAGAADFFARLSQQQQRGAPAAGRRLAGYLDTHPLHADRIAALAREAAAHGWATAGELTRSSFPPAE